jgi:hypothetical protein
VARRGLGDREEAERDTRVAGRVGGVAS